MRGSKCEAKRALTALLAEPDEGAHRYPLGVTLADLLTEWQALKARSWGTHTALENEGYVDRWIAPAKDGNYSERWHWCPENRARA